MFSLAQLNRLHDRVQMPLFQRRRQNPRKARRALQAWLRPACNRVFSLARLNRLRNRARMRLFQRRPQNPRKARRALQAWLRPACDRVFSLARLNRLRDRAPMHLFQRRPHPPAQISFPWILLHLLAAEFLRKHRLVVRLLACNLHLHPAIHHL